MPFKDTPDGQTYSCSPHKWVIKKGRRKVCDICGLMAPREKKDHISQSAKKAK